MRCAAVDFMHRCPAIPACSQRRSEDSCLSSCGIIANPCGVILPSSFNAALLTTNGCERGTLPQMLPCTNSELTVWLKSRRIKLLYSELSISGSGSANVGDRGICWDLKPFICLCINPALWPTLEL